MKNNACRFLFAPVTCAALNQAAALSATQTPATPTRPEWLVYLAVAAVIAAGVSICAVVLDMLARFVRKVFRSCFRPKPAAKTEPDYSAWSKDLNKAVALGLKTDNFSDDACEAAATANREAILAAHTRIEAKEASRQLTAKEREKYFDALATWGASYSSLEKAALVDILLKWDVWEYRTLRAAKKQAIEVVNG